MAHSAKPEERRQSSAIPSDALSTIQTGSVQYKYKNVLCLKNPFDLALYTRLIHEERPQTIIEIGSHMGGSALWFADVMRAAGIDGHIYSIDLKLANPPIKEDMVTFMQGNCLDLEKVLPIRMLNSLPRPLLVIEDGAHYYETSIAVLHFFHKFMKTGEYIVVEDGIVEDLGAKGFKNGPNRAIFAFLDEQKGKYEIDTRYCDYYGHNFTWCTNGWLKRVEG